MLEANQDKYMMCASCQPKGQEEKDKFKGLGLVAGHAYGVIDVVDFEHEGEQLQLLKVRNPWGSHEWNGDWSDKSELWTDDLKEKLRYEDSDDGIFWMNFQDFQDCFKRVQICKYRDDYVFNSTKFDASYSGEDYHVITMKAPSGEQTLSLSQKDVRFYPDNSTIEYSNCRIILAKQTEEGLVYIQGITGYK